MASSLEVKEAGAQYIRRITLLASVTVEMVTSTFPSPVDATVITGVEGAVVSLAEALDGTAMTTEEAVPTFPLASKGSIPTA
jgi:hypothetical protein